MKTLRFPAKNGQSLTEYAAILALVVLVVVLILSLTGRSLASVFCAVTNGLSPAAATSCSVLISDGFGNMNNWKNVYGNPSWSVSNGILTMVSGDQRLINKTQLPADYRMTINAAQLLSGPGYALLFRQSPSGSSYSGYSFQVDPGLGNKFVFRRYDQNGVELSTPLSIGSPPANFNWNAPHKVEVLVQGSTFQAYIDGVQVLAASDTTYAAGQVGLRTWSGSNATFSNLIVTPP